MPDLQSPVSILIDRCHGVSAPQRLLKMYGASLMLDIGGRTIPLNSAVQLLPEFTERGETINTLFSPDNNYQEDNSAICFAIYSLSLLSSDNQLWPLEFDDGHIVAVDPQARWNPDTCQYEVTSPAGCAMM